MSTAIIVICVVMLIGLVLVRMRQGKAEAEQKQKKLSKPTPNVKGNKKVAQTKEKKAEKTTENKPKEINKPKVDISNLLSQIDVMIADRQFAKAEGVINQTLNQDATQHALYSKLMNIYVLQNDDFAMNQLLTAVQNLGLNEVYQELFNRKEAYLEDKAALAARDPRKADVIEYTPSTNVAETPDFDALNTHHNANATSSTNEPLTFNNPTSASSFDELNSNIEPTSPLIEPPPVEFNLEQDLEFKLDKDISDQHNSSTNELTFNDESLTDDSFDTHNELRAEESIFTETVIEESPQFENQTIESGYIDADDPISQAFPTLAQVDPVELDIELAEQYVRLGEIAAAKQLLNVDQTQLNADQAEKVQQLLQKIA
ncbi:hypothetical protein MKI79_05305 [Acinetobacter sp. A3.8]|uniref:FimV domain-containing protein n=1 Tax=Acinetobacter sedimenti TaxID=2919922 RepID=A0A9X2B8P7_9GAMM|nr:hypothetical protein [Acinetobacter sedimenti]MCJ8146319.1 hypothetical protein [Acinetobacter sedimenti]